MESNWPDPSELRDVASPGLLIDADRVANNIQQMVALVGNDPSRLRPHVKTHKMSRVVQMQRQAGIEKFKAATLAEAEMVAKAGGKEVLVAYQMVGPNVGRLAGLVSRYPETEFATVVDHPDALAAIAEQFSDRDRPLSLLIDVDCGMHRTGIELGPGLESLRAAIESRPGVRYQGLHVYDGHLHDPSELQRQQQVERIIESVRAYDREHPSPMIVGGGSPTFGFWAKGTSWQCSPGTPVFWDVGYGTSYPDLHFGKALALVTRVISKPGKERVCLDLGYKSVAAEMPLERRVAIPEIPDAEMLGQSEEHLVVATKQADALSIGQAFLAFPRHVCPTVALHAFANIVRQGKVCDEVWRVDARDRSTPQTAEQ